MRKGRFDEIFFVDLPGPAEREAIFAIHLRKRRRDKAQFDLPRLAAAAEGFTGAEIEQAVVSGLYAAFAEKAECTTEHIARGHASHAAAVGRHARAASRASAPGPETVASWPIRPHFYPQWGRHSCLPGRITANWADKNVCPTKHTVVVLPGVVRNAG